MRQTLLLLPVLFGLSLTGIAMAEQDMEAAKAECQAQAEDQGVTDVEVYVAQCIDAKMAEQSQKSE